MNGRDYKKSIVANCSANEAYLALTQGIEHWWTKPDVPICKEGDRAKFMFPPNETYWVFQATDLVPDERVVLECVEAYHKHDGAPQHIEQEWLSTKAIFNIEGVGDAIAIHFEHVGLNPSLLCFDVCESGWDFFFLRSLKKYLDSGEGSPHTVRS